MPASLYAAETWQRLGVDNGVQIDTREVASSPLPEFRGTAVVAADMYEVLAVLDDLRLHCEWQKRCVQAKELRRESAFERLFYSRVGAPWPLQDRDVVLRGRVSFVGAGAELLVTFEQVRDARWPAYGGVVRMPVVRGHYRLTRIDVEKTKVEFQVLADPGGMVPAWAAKLTARQVPRDTLVGLRNYLPKIKGKYAAFLQIWRTKPANGPIGPTATDR